MLNKVKPQFKAKQTDNRNLLLWFLVKLTILNLTKKKNF